MYIILRESQCDEPLIWGTAVTLSPVVGSRSMSLSLSFRDLYLWNGIKITQYFNSYFSFLFSSKMKNVKRAR